MRCLLFVLTILIVAMTLTNATTTTSLISSINQRRKSAHVSRTFKESVISDKETSLNGLTAGFFTKHVQKPPPVPPTAKYLQLTILFTLWYALNAGFNVYNSKMKQSFQYPIASASLQLIVGVIFRALPMWLFKFRALPKISLTDFAKLLPIAVMNAMGHAFTIYAMFQKGGGSFTHVIKASEPVVSVLLALLVNRVVPKPFTALSLLPITYGVAYASTLGNLNVATMSKEFTSVAAIMAMASNVAFSARSILRKNLPKDFQQRTNLDPVNEFAVTTILSFLLTLPFVFYFENVSSMTSSLASLGSDKLREFWINTLLCGGCFYLYNELQNIVLNSLGAVPTAVGNTLKRVVIFVALYFFTPGETFPLPKIVGCAIAIAGCFGFAVFDSMKI